MKPLLDSDASVPARYYRSLPEILATKGVDVGAVLSKMAISVEQLQARDERFSAAQLEQIVSVLVVELGLPEVALDLGARVHLRDHSVVGYAIICSPTVDYSLQITARFFKQMFPAFRMRYQSKPDVLELVLSPAIAMSPLCLRFHIEMVAVAVHTGVKELIPISMPQDGLELSTSEPLYREHFARVLPRTKVQYSALASPGMRLTLPVSLRQRKPAMANPETLALAEQQCLALQQQIVKQRNIGEWVRMMLREASNGLPGIDELAATLNVSERTLHRYLQKEKLVYRRLCVEERNRRGCDLLANTVAPITWIAHELGYVDASNFTRAFRKEQSCTPSEYRAKAGGTTAKPELNLVGLEGFL